MGPAEEGGEEVKKNDKMLIGFFWYFFLKGKKMSMWNTNFKETTSELGHHWIQWNLSFLRELIQLFCAKSDQRSCPRLAWGSVAFLLNFEDGIALELLFLEPSRHFQ